MSYILRLFDEPLIEFELLENLADPVLRMTKVVRTDLLPIDLEPNEESLSHWLKHRTIPKNRAYVNAFLAKCGLNPNRPMDVLSVCHGLSLNDSYWVTEDGDARTFEQCNLYDNRFSQVLAWTAFTGYGSSIRSSFLSSPEFTTNGMLPKCWRRLDGEIRLYKGGTSGFSNAGCEPYSEFYAAQIGQKLGVNVIPYRLSRWKGNLCSVCKLFTGKEVSYVPVGRIVRAGGMRAVRAYYETLGPEFVRALDEMIVFDAVICNTDRHYGNFGLLIDSRTREIMAPAPLFDHGNALFNYAGEENWASEDVLQNYIDTLVPVAYPDFIEEAKKVMTPELRGKVRGLLDLHIEKQGRINYPDRKLRMIEKQVRKRAALLLEW